MTRVALARAVSIVAHPVVLMSAAGVLAASGSGASSQQLQRIGIALAALGVVVVGFSWWQVRRGRWLHVDASVKTERASLNVFLVAACLLGAALLWLLAGWRTVPVGMVLSGMLVVTGMLAARWVKMSLHAAFAAFATLLLWPSVPAVVGGMLVTATVVWSRLVLRRHVTSDVVAGLLVGIAAGGAYQMWTT